MSKMNLWESNSIWLLLLGVLLIVMLSVGVILWYRHKTRQTMELMDRMLDEAIRGDFLESHFDESLLSAVETKLAHYLTASEVSAKNLAGEKEKIKELIGDISHQTKTPISNILLYSQLLQEQDLPASAEIYVNPLSVQAEKLRFLIETLVKTSRLETGILELNPVETSMKELLRVSLEQIRPLADAKQIQVVCLETDISAVFDLKWTTEALYNLLDNAVKYTQGGGSIIIEAVSYEMFCRITVTDNGMGIPEEEHAKIFARFYRSPAVSQEPGVGIGLYLTRQIAAAQGGYVKVESRAGCGASFSLFLPNKTILQNR